MALKIPVVQDLGIFGSLLCGNFPNDFSNGSSCRPNIIVLSGAGGWAYWLILIGIAVNAAIPPLMPG